MRSIQAFSSDLRQRARAERDCSSSKHYERNASRRYACPEGRSFSGFSRTKLFVFSPTVVPRLKSQTLFSLGYPSRFILPSCPARIFVRNLRRYPSPLDGHMGGSLRGSCDPLFRAPFFPPGVRYQVPKLSAPDPGSKSAAIGYRAAPTHPFLTAPPRF